MRGYGGKTLRKGVLSYEWKTPCEMSTASPGSEHDDVEELCDDALD